MILYGIKNCDSVKKACKFLEQHQLEYNFFDFKKETLTAALIQSWLKHTSWEVLLNRRSKTFRELPSAAKIDINAQKAVELMCEHPTLVKRPVLEGAHGIFVGFDTATYETLTS
tara:strand:+ start:3463 stop:3804 length:342 start_codon:yes stop_codon:yes gene_type:complete